jgi:hypothetical protein
LANQLDPGLGIGPEFADVVREAPVERFLVEVDPYRLVDLPELDPLTADGRGPTEIFAEAGCRPTAERPVDPVREVDFGVGGLHGPLIENVGIRERFAGA